MSEGISFQRELEFQNVIDKLKSRKGLDRDEKALVSFFEQHGGLERVAEEYEFFTWMWRIVRFLRVICDARINSGKQDHWPFEKHGLPSTIPGTPRNRPWLRYDLC